MLMMRCCCWRVRDKRDRLKPRIANVVAGMATSVERDSTRIAPSVSLISMLVLSRSSSTSPSAVSSALADYAPLLYGVQNASTLAIPQRPPEEDCIHSYGCCLLSSEWSISSASRCISCLYAASAEQCCSTTDGLANLTSGLCIASLC